MHKSVYEDPSGNNRRLSWILDLKEDVEMKLCTGDYSWAMRYVLVRKSDNTELHFYADFTGRYVFQDRIDLKITIDSSDMTVTKKFEIQKISGQQLFIVDFGKENIPKTVMSNIELTFKLTMAAIKHCGDSGTIAVFTEDDRPHDVILVVGDTKFYVHKTYMATWSKFFDKLFFGEDAEKDKKEITIEDIDAEEFETLLLLIHPDLHRKFDDDNVEYLLELGDRFEMPSVMAMCAVHLTNFANCPHLSLMDRLELSDKYILSRLQVVCLKKCHEMNAVDFKNFFDVNRDRIKKLSHNTIQNLI